MDISKQVAALEEERNRLAEQVKKLQVELLHIRANHKQIDELQAKCMSPGTIFSGGNGYGVRIATDPANALVKRVDRIADYLNRGDPFINL